MTIDEGVCDAKVLSKDCPHGSWCCLDKTKLKTECVKCDHEIFGACLSTSHQTCDAQGMESWNQLGDVESYLNQAGGSIAKQAAESVCRKYELPCP
jgi:hypothetical protein